MENAQEKLKLVQSLFDRVGYPDHVIYEDDQIITKNGIFIYDTTMEVKSIGRVKIVPAFAVGTIIHRPMIDRDYEPDMDVTELAVERQFEQAAKKAVLFDIGCILDWHLENLSIDQFLVDEAKLKD